VQQPGRSERKTKKILESHVGDPFLWQNSILKSVESQNATVGH
jgi:hypothetical protein